ncbi:MAG: tRNA preQ1(34) S-adenosylmethionine ribosyltransferase-isomerase QueA [Clostridia bacterium]|nr:tRNA preQ1(34) S-adenosylmethionine ribosyltransferase-isomerase QueA [Clostridia bacterium]
MKTSDFDYNLPEELIAQHPLTDRSSSRLMVVDRKDGSLEEKIFKDIIDYLNPGDLLVLNDTRVIPARIYGIKEETGINCEILLLKKTNEEDTWECLVKPGRRLHEGNKIIFGDGLLTGEIVNVLDDGNRIIKFTYEGIWEEILDKIGVMPLPPYIHEKLEDKERYQTVYSKYEGSAAAPTAGLHFTKELLSDIKAKGVNIGYVTLHVGLGTFRPVQVDDVTNHVMHTEYCHVPKETADMINETKKNGHRVIAVGTTSVRTLESIGKDDGTISEGAMDTQIFIYPGYKFKIVDALITNFHLPKSTLLMLVSALSSKELMLKAYEKAVEDKFRFFSFGDAMFIK